MLLFRIKQILLNVMYNFTLNLGETTLMGSMKTERFFDKFKEMLNHMSLHENCTTVARNKFIHI